MKLTSVEFVDGDELPNVAVSKFLGGEDKSPVLQFEGVPDAAKSLAITCYDPDAPTGSGFWHWIVVNMAPQSEGEISSAQLLTGALTVINDKGTIDFAGANPPAGDDAHRYIFTLHALSCEIKDADKLSQAYVRFNIYRNQLASASITGLYKNKNSI